MRAEEHKKNVEKWKLLVKERLDSGISVTKFCEANGYTENMYYHWVNTIHKADPSFVTNNRIGRPDSEKASHLWRSALHVRKRKLIGKIYNADEKLKTLTSYERTLRREAGGRPLAEDYFQ